MTSMTWPSMSARCVEAACMLFDTDVLIWCFRGVAKAGKVIEDDPAPSVSIVTYMELIQGARDKKELKAIASFLAEVGIRVLPLTENIGHRASIYLEEHALKNGMAMADALIAATAVEGALSLCTGNAKHFRVISDLELDVFKP
jgi:predicted nucleic acid-binding protein